ncbi:MAG: hypothetical protein ACRDUA_13570, partial [Micromonosporaceae bacterium]
MTFPFWVVPQSVLIAVLHLYLWWRLVRGTTAPRSRIRRVATLAVVVLGTLIPAALITTHTVDPTVSQWFAWPGYVWYGVLVYLLVILVLAEPVRITIGLAQRHRRRSAASTRATAPVSPAVVPATAPPTMSPTPHGPDAPPDVTD